jgi:hypothetical protein
MYVVVIAIVLETKCLARILDPDYYTSRLPDPTSTKEEGEKHLSNFFHLYPTTPTKEDEEKNLSNFFSVFLSVFRIHDILGWIRIRIRILGSMLLTSGSGSSYCRH